MHRCHSVLTPCISIKGLRLWPLAFRFHSAISRFSNHELKSNLKMPEDSSKSKRTYTKRSATTVKKPPSATKSLLALRILIRLAIRCSSIRRPLTPSSRPLTASTIPSMTATFPLLTRTDVYSVLLRTGTAREQLKVSSANKKFHAKVEGELVIVLPPVAVLRVAFM